MAGPSRVDSSFRLGIFDDVEAIVATRVHRLALDARPRYGKKLRSKAKKSSRNADASRGDRAPNSDDGRSFRR